MPSNTLKTSEQEVQSAILDALTARPDVAIAWRQNSGAMRIKDARGRERFVKFNTCEGMSDIVGLLEDGRAFFLEVKPPGWKMPTAKAKGKDAERCRVQESFLSTVREANAIASFVQSVEQAMALLDEKDEQ